MKKSLIVFSLLMVASSVSAIWNPFKTDTNQEDLKAIVHINEGLADLEGRVAYLHTLSQLNMNSEFISDQLGLIQLGIASLNMILGQFKAESPGHKTMIEETISNRVNQLSATIAQLSANLKK